MLADPGLTIEPCDDAERLKSPPIEDAPVHNQSMIKQWLCDSAIAFLLIVGGILSSRHLAGWFNAQPGLGYLCCLLIAAIPLACFLGMRRGFFRWWEYLGFIACVVSITVARAGFVQFGANRSLVAILVPGMFFGCFICLHHALRITGKAASPRAGSDPS